MCGICGILKRDGAPVSRVILRRMVDSIIHRGPDGHGTFIDDGFGLGHCRLAIIDPSPAGNQPMLTRDGRYVISYNGELYNFQEIKTELTSLGVPFFSNTDTEVVLNALATWGVPALDRFNGMFALAFWDKKTSTLLLARDRYGVKPLYYCLSGNNFLFSSEIKGILAHPSSRPELDKEGLVEYFTFQNFFTERTLFRGIRMLSHGSFLTLRIHESCEPRIHRYWDFCFVQPHKEKDEREYVEELDRLFRQAVNRQLVADVELGSYLSGGVDSGSITAVASTQLPEMKTFTCGFDLHSAQGLELAFDERSKAEYLSYLFKTEHYEMVLKAGDLERILPKLTRHLEEPRVGQSYPNYYVAQLASKFVKVVLSGAGGDEIFGGYPWRYYRAAVNNNFEDYIEKYYLFWQRLVPDNCLPRVFKPIWPDVSDVSTRGIFKSVFTNIPEKLSEPEDYINCSLYFEAKTFLHGLLVVEDKLSMAHGLETRVPFLDNQLVDFAQTLPVGLKLGNLSEVVRLNENEPGPKSEKYYHKTRDGKLIMREAMRKYVPDEITQTIKQGFSAPDASWFKGDSIEFVKRTLYGKNVAIFDFLDRQAVHELVDQHLCGKENRRLLIWSLLNFESWCREFLC